MKSGAYGNNGIYVSGVVCLIIRYNKYRSHLFHYSVPAAAHRRYTAPKNAVNDSFKIKKNQKLHYVKQK